MQTRCPVTLAFDGGVVGPDSVGVDAGQRPTRSGELSGDPLNVLGAAVVMSHAFDEPFDLVIVDQMPSRRRRQAS